MDRHGGPALRRLHANPHANQYRDSRRERAEKIDRVLPTSVEPSAMRRGRRDVNLQSNGRIGAALAHGAGAPMDSPFLEGRFFPWLEAGGHI